MSSSSQHFSSPPPLRPDSKPVSLSFPKFATPEQENTVAVITLNAPERLNALSTVEMLDLLDALHWIEGQKRIIVTVLTGMGRFFSAGVNVKSIGGGSAAGGDTPRNAVSANPSLGEVLHHHNKLLVGAMNGPAVGIVATMLAHCDLLYTFEDFWLALPFMSLALVSEGLACLTFAKKMGLGRAQVALLEGKRMEAPDLRQSGFVAHIFVKPPPPPGTEPKSKTYTPPILDKVLEHLSNKFLPPALDPVSLRHTKEMIRAANYDGWTVARTHREEMKGAQMVFASGRPQKQFERIVNGGRHKL